MKDIIKTTIKRTGMALLFLATIAITLTSCGNDDEPTPNNNGEEKETAFVRGIGSSTPNGYFIYLEIVEDLATTPDLSKAVELGVNTSTGIYSFNGQVITLDNDSKTLTKWKVDQTTLEPSVDDVLSYASTGVTSTNLVFTSETKAFICDIAEGVFVEFNPVTMELTKTHQVTPLSVPDKFSFYTKGKLYNGKIIFPIQWATEVCCDYPTPVYATVGIFDPAAGTLTYDTDERAIGVNGELMIDGDDAYLVPANSQNAWMNHYHGASLNPHIVLKLNTDGTIDDNFKVDIKDGLPDATLIRGSTFVYEGKYIFLYSEDEITGPFDDRYTARQAMEYKSASYDLNTQESTLYDSFEGKGYNQVYLYNTIDGVNYLRSSGEVNGIYTNDILIQNSLESYTVISTIQEDSYVYLNKLW